MRRKRSEGMPRMPRHRVGGREIRCGGLDGGSDDGRNLEGGERSSNRCHRSVRRRGVMRRRGVAGGVRRDVRLSVRLLRLRLSESGLRSSARRNRRTDDFVRLSNVV